jgi:predicted phage terminase large subunit-like protein
MCNPDGQIIVTGTYVYDGDLIDRIEKNKEYHTVKYPAAIRGGPQGLTDPLWPGRWDIAHLLARERELAGSDDPFAFDKEYLLQKVDAKAQFFKRSMFKFYDPSAMPDLMSRVGSWDPAISLNGDFNAMMATGTDEKKITRLLPEYAEFKSDNVQALIDEQFRLTELYDIPYWIVETIGFQKLLKEHIYDAMREKNRHFGIQEIKHHIKSKQARIMSLQPRIESGSLLFHPTAHEDVIRQFCSFPRGQHDDMIDALASMLPAWDKPHSPTKQAPHGSMDWWREQVVDESASNWYNTLAK